MTTDFTKEFALFGSIGDLVKEVRDFIEVYERPGHLNVGYYHKKFRELIDNIDKDMAAVGERYPNADV